MRIDFSPPDITEAEIEEVARVLRTGWITTGPETKQFENDLSAFCGAPATVCFNSATASMALSLKLLGIGPGDEVITSAYTYTASASVIIHVGAKPVLVDIEPDSLRIDPAAIEAAITERTKAVIPVDLGGIPVDYDAIRAAIERKRGLFRPKGRPQTELGRVAIVGDCAHALGALYKGVSVAHYCDFACFSFHAVKNLTTSEGGAACFGDIGSITAAEIYEEFQLLSLHGQNKDALKKTRLGEWEYEILFPGYKCNMTDVLAALGVVQLRRYPGLLERRRELLSRYERRFEGSPVKVLPHEGPDYASSRHLCITSLEGADVERRNQIIVALADAGIAANVHYKPLPMMTAYRGLGFDMADYPRALDFYRSELTLPMHTLMSDQDVDYVADTLLGLLG